MKEKNTQLARGAGLLMPVSSLPSPYGIGTLGKEAYLFADALAKAGQTYWQVLPVGPTSYGDSPYQSFSAFAGNPYFIDLDTLIEEGLLEKGEPLKYDWGNKEDDIDYAAIFNSRFLVLKKAYKNSKHKKTNAYESFLKENAYWLFDYSFYMALKNKFKHVEWLAWDEDIRLRKKKAIEKYKKELKDEIEFWEFCQYKFYEQWMRLKEYVNKKGIRIIGDIPLYVSLDSTDVWTKGELFELNSERQPVNVAGVPPDLFSETGQRWGNPLYNWDVMKEDGFAWWRERMKANARLYDVIRIDHFIGIVRYYSIPSSCPTAMEGKWRKGPGVLLTDAIKESIGEAKIIAEDLGIVVPSVRRLIKKTGWPGMKILEFAFDEGAKSDFLPHNYKNSNNLVYGGTHDNETIVGYLEGKTDEELSYLYSYLAVKKREEVPAAMLRAAYASISSAAVFQMQDILRLNNTARMNLPSTVGNNWRWRLKQGQFTGQYIKELKKLAKTYGRLGETKPKEKRKGAAKNETI